MAGNVDATLAKVTAVLAVKAAVINLLTARARLKHSDHATGRPEPWKEDVNTHKALLPPFRLAFATFLPSPSTARLVGLMHNCMENEPYFLALALAASRVNDPAATSKLLTVYCTARCVHSVVFLSGLPQPLRAMAYLTGLGAAILLAVSVLSA